MSKDELQAALSAVGGEGFGYIDVLDDNNVVLDATFTLEQLVAVGDVARAALASPKVGDTIRVTEGCEHFYTTGDFATLMQNPGGDIWLADFNDPRNSKVYMDGLWAICAARFEVVR